MSEDLLPPDERMLRLHLESGRFRSGVAAGWWRLVSLDWPYVVMGITARDSVEYGFRFQCADYPHQGGHGAAVGYRKKRPAAGQPVAERPGTGSTCL